MSLNNAFTHGKLQRCQTQRSDMQIPFITDNSGNHSNLDDL